MEDETRGRAEGLVREGIHFRYSGRAQETSSEVCWMQNAFDGSCPPARGALGQTFAKEGYAYGGW